jgi:hypothetical protein
MELTMWGNWLFLVFGGVGVVLVLIAAIVLASPLLAILIAVVALLAAVPLMSALRSRSERGAGLAGGAGGAPVSGEGAEVGSDDVTAAQRARPRSSSRISGGIWGERRDT